MQSVELAQSIAAAMQLRLPGTAGGVARKLQDLFKQTTLSDLVLLDLPLLVVCGFLANGVPNAILTKYRKRIVEQFLPKRGNGKLDLRSARRTIRDYRKATYDLAGTIDLMLTYVEGGTEFTNQFGDALSTAILTSLSTTASNPCWMKSLYPAHGRAAEDAGRCSALSAFPGSRESAGEKRERRCTQRGIGWGYGDHVTEQIELLEAEVGRQWERCEDEGHAAAE